MIIYQEIKKKFLTDVEDRDIDQKIADFYFQKLGRRPSPSEKRSWKNSLEEMYHVINHSQIHEQSQVTIEYNLPNVKYRVDFIISGTNKLGKPKAILIELKQWEKAAKVKDKDGIVSTFLGGNPSRETMHPSYQIWSYLQYIKDYSRCYYQKECDFQACVYLHNYKRGKKEPLLDDQYSHYVQEAPIYFHKEKKELTNFIANQIVGADETQIINLIDSEPKVPGLTLQKDIYQLITNNKEFILLDSQKIVFEEIKRMYSWTRRDRQKRIIVVEGGPGTGKSVLAFQLLAKFLKTGSNVAYVTKNSAVRNVFAHKLTQPTNNPLSKMRVKNLMLSSEAFIGASSNIYDCLLVDEAHRLSLTGVFKNKGENQIREIINASRLSVFFVDNFQAVTSHDVGQRNFILEIAGEFTNNSHNIKVLTLKSQFRMNGSNDFLIWLDDVLTLEPREIPVNLVDYDFKIVPSVDELYQKVKRLNTHNNARILAGYCWDWVSKNDSKLTDINLSSNFRKKWNLNTDSTWAVSPNSFEQIGCVYAAQGLEFDYTGVIIGDDLAIKEGRLITQPLKRAKTDTSLRGLVKLIRAGDEAAKLKAHNIILNTYRVLLTRATKGCYVYFTNPEVEEYFNKKLNKKG